MRNQINEIHGTKYYTGLHPSIKQHYRSGRRPKEFGNKIWHTSFILADHFENGCKLFSNQRVLEIGCGQGVLGIFLAKKYSCEVTCSDFDEGVLPIVQMNANLNNVEVKAQKFAFSEISKEYLEQFDVIVGAEVCYNEEVGKDLLLLTKRALEAGVSKILIGDPGRPDFDELVENCSSLFNTEVYQLPKTKNGKITNLLIISKRNKLE